MPRIAVILIAALLGLALPRDLPAQSLPAPGDSAKAMAGGWELSNAERDKT